MLPGATCPLSKGDAGDPNRTTASLLDTNLYRSLNANGIWGDANSFTETVTVDVSL